MPARSGVVAMPLERLDHYSVRTLDIERTTRFYVDVLGLTDGARPPFEFPGAWLYAGDKAVVHVIGVGPNGGWGMTDGPGAAALASGPGSGTLDHISFWGSGLGVMRDHLTALGIPFQHRRIPGRELSQLFVDDPNGITVELTYPETIPL